MTKAKKQQRQDVHAALWVILVTYFLCWSAGVYLVATTTPGDWQRLVIAVFLIVWPLSGTSPIEVLRAWRGG